MRISDWSSDVCSSDLRVFDMTFAKLHCLNGKEQLDRAAVIVWLRMNEVERFGEFLRWCQEGAPAISPFGDAFQWRLSIATEPQWQVLWLGFIANIAE